jgi:hypothetical protein
MLQYDELDYVGVSLGSRCVDWPLSTVVPHGQSVGVRVVHFGEFLQVPAGSNLKQKKVDFTL